MLVVRQLKRMRILRFLGVVLITGLSLGLPLSPAVAQDAGRPVFIDLEAFSSDNVTVTAGDRVTVLVTAIYDGGAGAAIPCGSLNLGVLGDQPANFRDDATGTWPESAWRSPDRVAADGCIGEAGIGTRLYWPVKLYVPPETPAGTHSVGTFSPVWDGVNWSTSQIAISVTVRGPSAAIAATAAVDQGSSTPSIFETTPPSAPESGTTQAATASASPVELPAAKPGRLVVSVVDEAAQPLTGNACFDVYIDAGDGAWGTLIAHGCDETDGGDGTVTLEGVIAGDYVVVQNMPPDGYAWAADQRISIAPGEETRLTVVQPVVDAITATTEAGIEATPAVTEAPAPTEVTPETPEPIAPINAGAVNEATPIAASATSSLPTPLVGTWEGQGVQTSPDAAWPVTITFRGGDIGEAVASIEYPSYGCTGELTLDRVEPERGRIVLTENITVGEGTCVDGGSMALSLEPDGSLTFEWSSADGSSTATAQLDKVPGSVTDGGESGSVEPTPINQGNIPTPTPTEPVDDSGSTVIQPVDGSATVPAPDGSEVSGGPGTPQPVFGAPNDDARTVKDAAVKISRLEATRDFDALYNTMHPDAQAIIPREVVVGWYSDDLANKEAGELTATDVRFVDWTWDVNGVTYPNTAEIDFIQPYVIDGAPTEITGTLRLVEINGEWRWFFGQNRKFVDDQIEKYRLTNDSGDSGAVTGIAAEQPRSFRRAYTSPPSKDLWESRDCSGRRQASRLYLDCCATSLHGRRSAYDPQ